MRCSLDIVNLCSYVPQSLYGLEDSYATVQFYGSPLKASTPPFLPLPLPEMLKLSTVLLQPVRSERLQGSSSTCPCRHFNRLPFLTSRVILCVWTSLSLCGMSVYPKLGFCILGSDSRGSYRLPTHSTFSLTHFPSFYVNLGPNPPPVPLAHSCISHRMESRVISAVSFPQPHKLRPLDRKGSICAFMLSVFDFFGLRPLSLSLSLDSATA